jgi:hypothetical protein
MTTTYTIDFGSSTMSETIELTDEQRSLLAFELYESIENANETLESVRELGIEDELEADEESATVDEIEAYIEERKELLKHLDMPYFKLRMSAKIDWDSDLFNGEQ